MELVLGMDGRPMGEADMESIRGESRAGNWL